ncbi:MAG: hypothetical protein MI975_13210 [Cytophagales bacterium]|nr:hypothetical protein [Cytophagales bacterium]
MKNIYVFMSCLWFIGCFQKGKEEVLIPGMQNLYLLSDAKSRSISPENPSGEADRRGMTELEEGNAGKAASELGKGWKVNPYIFIQPGETTVLAEAQGPGIINHIRITPARGKKRPVEN